MPNVLISAFTGEGPTDKDFLGSIIDRTFTELLLESVQDIDTYPPVWLSSTKGPTQIVNTVVAAAPDKYMLICVHADTDSSDHSLAFNERIKPAIDELIERGYSKPPIIPILPVQETEAWMLSDVEALRKELGTNLSAQELDLHGNPERYADPKEKLKDVVRRANAGRGLHLQYSIRDLYEPLGNSIDLNNLANLHSYQRFREAAIGGLRRVGYLL